MVRVCRPNSSDEVASAPYLFFGRALSNYKNRIALKLYRLTHSALSAPGDWTVSTVEKNEGNPVTPRFYLS